MLELKSLIQYGKPSSDGNGPNAGAISSKMAIEIVAALTAKLEHIKHPTAKACVLWLTGQYAGAAEAIASPIPGVAFWAPDALRRLAKTFSSEVIPICQL